MSQELTSKYFETRAKYMHRLEKLNEEYLAKYYWMRDHIAVYLLKDKNAKILVLGSGLGHEVWALNKMGYSNVLGVDIDCEQVKIAKSMGINCMCADAIKFLEGSQDYYDVILAFNFLEHFSLEDAIKVSKLCYSHLRNNGALILSVPNAANPFSLLWVYGDLTHKIGAFTENSIIQLLRAAGFEEIIVSNVKPFGKDDNRLLRRLIKVFASIAIYINWLLMKLFYLLNGIVPPKVVSMDLLAIAIKR